MWGPGIDRTPLNKRNEHDPPLRYTGKHDGAPGHPFADAVFY